MFGVTALRSAAGSFIITCLAMMVAHGLMT